MKMFSLHIKKIDFFGQDALGFSQKNEDGKELVSCKGATLSYIPDVRFAREEGVRISQGALSFFNGLAYEYKGKRISSESISLLSDALHENVKSVDEVKGDFSCFTIAKNEISLFSCKTNSKPVFYFSNKEHFICASNVIELSRILKENGIAITLDNDGAYSLLSFGYILGTNTLVSEIKRLTPSTILTLSDIGVTTHEYYKFNTTANTQLKEADFIDQLDSTFSRAIDNEFSKDIGLGLSHMMTISGGMDSRMVMAYADKLGYTDLNAITFSQSNHSEHKIAKKVSEQYNANFIFHPLDGGDYLKNIDEPVRYNGGTCIYAGAGHTLSMLETLDFSDQGILHTGQLGDAVLGTYLAGPQREQPKLGRSLKAHPLSDKISNYVTEEFQSYENHELFKLYNKGFNEIFNGYRMIEQFTPFASAFMDEDFIKLALSIPPSMKFDRKLYYKWMNSAVPETTKVKITATNLPPKNLYLTPPFNLLPKFNSYLNLAKYALIPGHVVSMNPFKKWFAENESLNLFLNAYAMEHLIYLEGYNELRLDCENLLKGGFNDTFKVLTLLSSMKQLFN